jgi:maleate isomerase
MSPRKRIGVMIPSTNTTCEADFQLTVPRDVTVHGQRLWMTNDSNGDDAYVRMNSEIESGARYLATASVDVVVYGCTTGSFYKGPGWDTEMLELIRREARVPAVATSPSVVEALRFFGAKRLSVATPYPEWNNQRLRTYLEAQGFEWTGKPVVTSNQSTIWTALRALGITRPITGFGRLLETLTPPRPAPAAR